MEAQLIEWPRKIWQPRKNGRTRYVSIPQVVARMLPKNVVIIILSVSKERKEATFKIRWDSNE